MFYTHTQLKKTHKTLDSQQIWGFKGILLMDVRIDPVIHVPKCNEREWSSSLLSSTACPYPNAL